MTRPASTPGRAARAPKVSSFPAIRRALKFYRACSIVTGVMLLVLVAEMILKYSPLHLELFLGGSGGFLWLSPVIAGPECRWFSLVVPGGMGCEMTSVGDGFNVSLSILVAHGWFYVVYLFSCFRVWSLMRWTVGRFLLLACGGVVPLLSFFMEARVASQIKDYLLRREHEEHSSHAAPPTLALLDGEVSVAGQRGTSVPADTTSTSSSALTRARR